MWVEYSRGKKTYAELNKKCGISIPTIQKKLDNFDIPFKPLKARAVLIIMDTSYFKRTFGVMVFRDWYERENLLWKYVQYETIALYRDGINELEEKGFKIVGIVTDGRRGIFKQFGEIPVQMCHFHQLQIVRRDLTNHPKLEASIELKEIAGRLTRTDRVSFEYWLDHWFEKWNIFLNEKSEDPVTGKRQYMHRRLRSAYRSLRSNIPHLFVYQEYPELNMPNTTNSLDGSFAHVKDKVRLHRGLKLKRKMKLIDELLKKNVT